MELNNCIITIALRTLLFLYIAMSNPSLSDWLVTGGLIRALYVTHVSMRKRLTDGLSLSSEPAGGLPSPSGEWKSGRWSSRSLPSYELQEELRLSAGERPRTSCRLDPCCGCWGGKPDGVTRSRGGEMGSDLMFMLWLVLMDRLEPWGRWPPPLQERQAGNFVFRRTNVRCNNVKKPEMCICVIQHNITERSGCCFYVRASGECAFV